MKSVAQKLGIRENTKTYFKNAPEGIIDAFQLPKVILADIPEGDFDYIHLFVNQKSEQQKWFPILKTYLKLSGALWVSWPKSGQLGTDLSLPEVIRVGYEFGLVESTCINVNPVWSALKFTHPKKGKTYKNSHAELKARTTGR